MCFASWFASNNNIFRTRTFYEAFHDLHFPWSCRNHIILRIRSFYKLFQGLNPPWSHPRMNIVLIISEFTSFSLFSSKKKNAFLLSCLTLEEKLSGTMAITNVDNNIKKVSLTAKDSKKIDQTKHCPDDDKKSSSKSAAEKRKKKFQTSEITDWIRTKPSSVLIRVREREKRKATAKRPLSNLFRSA